MKVNLISGAESKFPQTHYKQIHSLFLSENQKTLFSGCWNGELKQHSINTLQQVGRTTNLGIGWLFGIDLKSNLLVVGGQWNFSLLQLTKIPKQSRHHRYIFSSYVYNMV